jgi:hypothetical protein
MTMLAPILRKLRSSLAGSLAVVLLAESALAVVPVPAFADEGNPPTPAQGLAGQALSRIYQWELTALDRQADRLNRIGGIVAKVQSLIDNLASQGKDVTPLQQALAAFQTQVALAQSEYDQAASILHSHGGFDGDGQVTDRSQALQTVRQAAQALRDCHRILLQAGHDLRQVLREWRANNRPQTATPAGSQL